MTIEEIKALRHFTLKEIEAHCPGPNDLEDLDPKTMIALDTLRDFLGCSIKITSLMDGVHVVGSMHHLGWAVDFRVEQAKAPAGGKIWTPNDIVERMFMAGFRGIGYYPEYKPRLVFHGDIRVRTALWKRVNGKYINMVEA